MACIMRMTNALTVEFDPFGCPECHNCCILRKATSFAELDEDSFAKMHRFIERQEMPKGQALYADGRSVRGIFVIRSGMVKLVRNTRDGRERIVRVLRSGDIVGLEALTTAQYESDAVALTTLAVCRIPPDVMEELLANNPHLFGELMKKWQQAVRDAGDWLTELNSGTARQRIASLIRKMCDPPDGDISTLLSLEDMGSMVDLKIETVSREVSRLVRAGALLPLDRHRRVFRVCKPDQLEVG
jgi:CRP/FNR family transcriptional regulator